MDIWEQDINLVNAEKCHLRGGIFGAGYTCKLVFVWPWYVEVDLNEAFVKLFKRYVRQISRSPLNTLHSLSNREVDRKMKSWLEEIHTTDIYLRGKNL